jgi:hypothetical protein
VLDGPQEAPQSAPLAPGSTLEGFKDGTWPPPGASRYKRKPRVRAPRALRRYVPRAEALGASPTMLVPGHDRLLQGLRLRSAAQSAAAAPLPRPRTRLECRDEARPCGWVGCRYHLGITVNPDTGAVKQTWPEGEAWEGPESCALDVAERGPATLEEVGASLNLTRERVRQIEVRALAKLSKLERRGLLSR